MRPKQTEVLPRPCSVSCWRSGRGSASNRPRPRAHRRTSVSPRTGSRLLQAPALPPGRNLRVNGNSGQRLHRSGETEVLAEAELRFHARVRFQEQSRPAPAVRGCSDGVSSTAAATPLAALAKRRLPVPMATRRAFSFGVVAGAIGDDHQRSVLKPAQQRAIRRRAQRPLPVILLGIGRTRLARAATASLRKACSA